MTTKRAGDWWFLPVCYVLKKIVILLFCRLQWGDWGLVTLSFNITSHWVICGNLLWNGVRMGQECLWYWMGVILLFNTMSHIYQAYNYMLNLQLRMLNQGISLPVWICVMECWIEGLVLPVRICIWVCKLLISVIMWVQVFWVEYHIFYCIFLSIWSRFFVCLL